MMNSISIIVIQSGGEPVNVSTYNSNTLKT